MRFRPYRGGGLKWCARQLRLWRFVERRGVRRAAVVGAPGHGAAAVYSDGAGVYFSSSGMTSLPSSSMVFITDSWLW